MARATGSAGRIAYEAEPWVGLGALPGVNQGALVGLQRAVQSFSVQADALDSALAAGQVKHETGVAAAMMHAERRILTGLVALDAFDRYIFPHQ